MAKIRMELENELTFEEGCEEYLQDCKATLRFKQYTEEMLIQNSVDGKLYV